MSGIHAACSKEPEDPRVTAWRAQGVHLLDGNNRGPCFPMRRSCAFRYWPQPCAQQRVCSDSPIDVRFAFSGKGRDKRSRTLAQLGVHE